MLDFGKSTGVKAQEETKSKKRQQQLEKKERELKREKWYLRKIWEKNEEAIALT